MRYAAIVKTPLTVKSRDTEEAHELVETQFIEFDSEDQLKVWIRAHHTCDYRVLQFDELMVETRLEVDLRKMERRT